MTTRYFLAIVLPEPAFSQVEAVKIELQERFGLKAALRSPAHITLHRPFVWEEKKERDLISCLNDFNFNEQFIIHLKGFGFFIPRVVFAAIEPSNQLEILHATLTRYCKQKLHLFNEAEDLRGFHPHVTVAFRDLKKNTFMSLQPEFLHRNIESSFHYNGFCLLKHSGTWRVQAEFPCGTA